MAHYLVSDLSDPRERRAILELKSLIPRLTHSEKSILAILALGQQDRLSQWLKITASTGFTLDLTNAFLQIINLSHEAQLGIAIELLKLQVNKEIETETTKGRLTLEKIHQFLTD